MKKCIIIILFLLVVFGCTRRKDIMSVSEDQARYQFRIEDPGKSVPTPPNGAEIYLSGTIFGYDFIQQDSLRYIGVWGDSLLSKPVNIGGGYYQIECWYKSGNYFYRFYPNVRMKRIDQNGSSMIDLKHQDVSFKSVSDSTGYSANMYHRMSTGFTVHYNQGGMSVDPLSNIALVTTTVEYTGVPDDSLTWPPSLNLNDVTEYGVRVHSGDSLFIVSTYNGLSGERKIPMIENVAAHKWTSDFLYHPNAGINIRVEKSNGEPLFMGVRLGTNSGHVSLSNIHYFPDIFGNNVWALFEASLVNGVPTIPHPDVNQLLNALEIVIGGNKKSNSPSYFLDLLNGKTSILQVNGSDFPFQYLTESKNFRRIK